MYIQTLLKNLIKNTLEELSLPVSDVTLEHPTDSVHGDYATNIALVLAKQVGQNPRDLAEKIQQSMIQNLPPEIEKITVAGPGFINVHLAPYFFQKIIPEIIEAGDHFGKLNIFEGKKILVEHSSPNLFKPFHIGHMMNNAIGESMVRLARASGADVRTMSFPSDISLGIAKAIFALQKEGINTKNIPTSILALGDAYVVGTRLYDEDESIHARVKEIADNLYAGISSPELDIYEQCKKLNIEYFEKVVERLGSCFDSYIYESEAGVVGKEIVLDNIPTVFTKSQGAVIYIPEETKKHLHTAVFINSQDNPTYEAKDLGLLKLKFDRENPDISIFVTDYQQVPHFQIVMDAAEKIKPLWSEKSVHIPHGRMSFKGQKMSSRLGGVPLATDVIETILAEVGERTKEREGFNSSEDADAVAIGAIKFAILRVKPGQNINFDPETSLSFEGDSGPYIQYTYARIGSLIEKGKELGIYPNYQSSEITDIEKIIHRFPGIVEHAIHEYAPQHIAVYLLEVARAFNSFYGSHKIIDEKETEISQHRLAIAQATAIVLKNGLRLLGIKAPERM